MAKENGGIIGVLNTPSLTSASGVWAIEDQYQAKRSGTWPLTPFLGTNSLRFNSASSDYLNRTFASAGNQKTMTISFWTKRSNLSSANEIISQGSGSACHIAFDSSNQMELNLRNSVDGGSNVFLITSQLFRDVSAWYHIVLALDTTQATNTNRAKLYVNGTQVTAFGTTTYPSQNGNLFFNEASSMEIGKAVGGTSYYNGYFYEFNFIGGQALTPSSFGASNASGVWYPIPYVGSYGTNGFNLKFGNSASLGTDSSPNGNNFTVNNLTSIDQTTDTPTNNFATMNPLNINTSSTTTFTEGNLKVAGGGTNSPIATSTFGVSKGKWYWEAKMTGTFFNVGFMRSDQNVQTTGIAYGAFGWVYAVDGNIYNNSVAILATGTTISANDIVSFLLDLDNGTLKLKKNGTDVYSGNAVVSSIPLTDYYNVVCNAINMNNEFNFGSPPYAANNYADAAGYGNFSYAVPSGYYALCTANLNTYG
jgi:hypothetical protein